MGEKYLIDTNVVIDLSEGKFAGTALDFVAPIIDNAPIISVINKIELLAFSYVPNEIKEFIETATVLSFSDEIVEKTIDIRKEFKTKLPDAIIAATALANNFTIITRNTKDFARIPNLKLIDPYKI